MSDGALHLRLGGGEPQSVTLREAVVAGWTGRDPAALEKHIRELQALGVARPATTPIFYRVAASRVTTAETIEVAGEASTGEVEFVLLQWSAKLWVGLGSDHTDRQVETYNVTVSKQMCEKPIAAELWAFEEVAPHWDRLVLRSFIEEKGERILYQEGALTAMRHPDDLIKRYAGAGLADGSLMFCGTLAARGAIRASPSFEMELEDPVLGRRIHHRYATVSLPVVG